MTDTPVSRGEFEMLVRSVADNARRIDSIDVSGTRGVGIVQTQLTDLAKDVASLSQRMDSHEREHEKDTEERKKSRRWVVATVIAVLTLVEGPLIYLVSLHIGGK